MAGWPLSRSPTPTSSPSRASPYDGTVVVTDGRITAVGPEAEVAAPAPRSSTPTGGWVLPGFVDAHTHVGVREEGEGWAGQDTNEMTDPVTAPGAGARRDQPRATWASPTRWPAASPPSCVKPGSGNPIGGQTASPCKTCGRTVDEMVLRSPAGVKSALGENPKRVYGDQKKTPVDPARAPRR